MRWKKRVGWSACQSLLTLAVLIKLGQPSLADELAKPEVSFHLPIGVTNLPATDLRTLPVTIDVITSPTTSQIVSPIGGTLSTQPLAQASVLAVGGDVSRTVFTPADGAAPASLGAKLSRVPDPKDFGASGDVIRAVLYKNAAIGDKSLTLTGLNLTAGVRLSQGAIIAAAGGILRPGTTVVQIRQNPSTASDPPTTTVEISSPVQISALQTDPGSTYFDFYTHDDTAAFQQAYKTAASTQAGVVHVSPGLYAMNSLIPHDPRVAWEFDNAELAQQGAIFDGINYGLQRQPTGKLFIKSLTYPDNENNVAIETAFMPTNSNHQYQKSALALQVYDADPGCLSELKGSSCRGTDGSADIGRGAIGLSIQGSPDAANHSYNLWGQETQLILPKNSDGAVTDAEFAVVNNSGKDNLEMGSLFNKSAATFIGSGSNIMASAISISGQKWQTGIDISTSVIGKAWAIRTEGSRGAKGIATTHADVAYADHNGKIFGQSLHIVSGSTRGDTDPTGGLTVDGAGKLVMAGSIEASAASLRTSQTGAQTGIGGVIVENVPTGQIDLGSELLPMSAASPAIRMHKGRSARADTFDLALQDTGSALRVVDGSGRQLAYISAETGLQGATISVSNSEGVVANFASSMAIQLTNSGFDMFNELGSKGLAVHTEGGYNAVFNADGSTEFSGPVLQTATDDLRTDRGSPSTIYILKKHVNRVTSCPRGGLLMLPAGASVGSSLEIIVLNRSGTACPVYPPSGGTIESNVTGAAISIQNNNDQIFYSMTPRRWYQ